MRLRLLALLLRGRKRVGGLLLLLLELLLLLFKLSALLLEFGLHVVELFDRLAIGILDLAHVGA